MFFVTLTSIGIDYYVHVNGLGAVSTIVGVVCFELARSRHFETMDQSSLEQMLDAIPPQRLNQKVNDTHLAEIARKLIKWKSVCTILGINEAEEKEIEEENKDVDARRYLHKAFVLLLRSVVHMCVSALKQ